MANYLIYDSNFKLLNDGSVNGNPLQDGKNVAEAILGAKVTFCSEFFAKNVFKHLIVLSGAGTSVGLNLKAEGKDRGGLWTACRDKIDRICSILTSRNEECKKAERDQDIEGFLSYVEKAGAVMSDNGDLKQLIVELKTIIRENCQLEFADNPEPHLSFLRKLTARKSSLPRVEIFTTNYDTLFEQAAKAAGIVVMDGFSFSMPRVFSGRNFDLDIVNRARSRMKNEENFIPNVIQLMKLHGSVDWKKADGNVLQCDPKDNVDALMIYPSSDKYSFSYDQPYFEMMSRFQMAVRSEETLLIVAGFGFKDKHLNNVIIEAVKQNPSFHLLILDYSREGKPIDLGHYDKLLGGIGANVSVFNGTFSEFVECMPMNKSYQISDSDERGKPMYDK